MLADPGARGVWPVYDASPVVATIVMTTGGPLSRAWDADSCVMTIVSGQLELASAAPHTSLARAEPGAKWRSARGLWAWREVVW